MINCVSFEKCGFKSPRVLLYTPLTPHTAFHVHCTPSYPIPLTLPSLSHPPSHPYPTHSPTPIPPTLTTRCILVESIALMFYCYSSFTPAYTPTLSHPILPYPLPPTPIPPTLTTRCILVESIALMFYC